MPPVLPALDTAAALAALRGRGFAHVPRAFAPADIATLTASVMAEYDRLEVLIANEGVDRAAAGLPPGTRYQPAAASLGLDAIPGWRDLLAIVPATLWRLAPELLGGECAIDVDISWARRQYPPHLRRAGQAPHMLHQDGAYGATFAPGSTLMPMLVFWIPLTEAGIERPGIECIAEPQPELVPLAALADAAAEVRWPTAKRLRPSMAPGDVLLIAGPHLHRTYVTADMTGIRTSLEESVVPLPLSPRLAGHTTMTLPG